MYILICNLTGICTPHQRADPLQLQHHQSTRNQRRPSAAQARHHYSQGADRVGTCSRRQGRSAADDCLLPQGARGERGDHTGIVTYA